MNFDLSISLEFAPKGSIKYANSGSVDGFATIRRQVMIQTEIDIINVHCAMVWGTQHLLFAKSELMMAQLTDAYMRHSDFMR